MKQRHRAREVVLQLLYRQEMANTGDALKDLTQHFEHFKVPAELREFAAQLVTGTMQEQAKLDELITTHASNWKLNRMSFVDRSLLRMSIYEMLHFPETAHAIVIDEAIELAKQFGTAETPAFINGILDVIKTSIEKPETNGDNQ